MRPPQLSLSPRMHRLLSSKVAVERAAQLRFLSGREHRLIHLQCIDTRTSPVFLPRSPLSCHSFIRHYATNPTPATASTKQDAQPPPVTGPKSKAKVELRPGPAKATSSSVIVTPKSVNPRAVRVEKPPNQDLHKPRKPPPYASDDKSILETAKRDIETAAEHGVLAPPPANAGIVRRLFHQVKELFKFYLGGIKRIFAHRRVAKEIQQRLRLGGQPLSRSEFKFLQRHRSDMRKVVPFILLLVVLEEIIPLIVIYAPALLPSTCVLPSQRERIERKRKEIQREAHVTGRSIFSAILSNSTSASSAGISISHLDDSAARLLCQVVGLSSGGPSLLRRKRLHTHLSSIAEDDMYLHRENDGAELSDTDLSEALQERGFVTERYSVIEQRKLLQRWLSVVNSGSGAAPEAMRALYIAKFIVHGQ